MRPDGPCFFPCSGFPIVSVGGTGWVDSGKAATIYQSCSSAVTDDIKAQDVLAFSRAPIRARPAEAEAHCLEVSISPLSCSGRLQALRGCPFDVTAIEPHPVEDHGDLSRQRDARPLGARAPGDPHAPGPRPTGVAPGLEPPHRAPCASA